MSYYKWNNKTQNAIYTERKTTKMTKDLKRAYEYYKQEPTDANRRMLQFYLGRLAKWTNLSNYEINLKNEIETFMRTNKPYWTEDD
ncbi:MAG: hypothetical protein M0R17_06965 [Candidatus Omnitrophica bacterium]|jgi:hypothetical protein|nr:hypothetical protein [Candidatus Omnitrophota bacterium]